MDIHKPYPQLSRSRKVLAVLVEADGHHAICGVESLLHTISVVYIYVNVEDTRMIPA